MITTAESHRHMLRVFEITDAAGKKKINKTK